MALYQYGGDAGRSYPTYDLANMQPADIVDFGAALPPADGRWTLYTGGSAANHFPASLSFVAFPPGGSATPVNGQVLTWSASVGAYVPQTFTAAGNSSGTASVYAGPTLPTYPTGTEYVWWKTDGAGHLLDILSGVAP